MTDDVVGQAFPLLIVHDVAHQGARLPEVVVVGAQGVGLPDQLAVGVPAHLGGACRVGPRTVVGVRRVHRVGGVGAAHRPVLGVGVQRRMRGVDRVMFVVTPVTCLVGVGVGV